MVGQEDYIKDVINRYGSKVKEKIIPVPKEIEKDGEDGDDQASTDVVGGVVVGNSHPAGHQLWRESYQPAACAASEAGL